MTNPCFIGISFATLIMANGEGRAIIGLQRAVAAIPFESDKEREEFLEGLANTFPKRLMQSYKTWKNNRVVKEREDANKPVPKPDNAPDRLQKHKEDHATEQEARKKSL